MKRLLAAIRFLTILPIPGSWGTAEADLAGSVAFFPVVGLLLGAVAAAAGLGNRPGGAADGCGRAAASCCFWASPAACTWTAWRTRPTAF